MMFGISTAGFAVVPATLASWPAAPDGLPHLQTAQNDSATLVARAGGAATLQQGWQAMLGLHQH